MLLHEWKLEEAQQVSLEEGMEKGIKAKDCHCQKHAVRWGACRKNN